MEAIGREPVGMKMRLRDAIVAITLLGMATGCSSGVVGAPLPPTSGDAGSTAAAFGKAPRVLKPLDSSKMVASPCTSLTDTDLAALGLTGASITQSMTNGPSCNWQLRTVHNQVAIAWMTTNPDGLSDEYARKSNEGYFEPTTVNGYPAVFASPADQRSLGSCVINVGVTDKLYFFASYDALTDPQTMPKACDLAKQAAAAVIKNLGGG